MKKCAPKFIFVNVKKNLKKNLDTPKTHKNNPQKPGGVGKKNVFMLILPGREA